MKTSENIQIFSDIIQGILRVRVRRRRDVPLVRGVGGHRHAAHRAAGAGGARGGAPRGRAVEDERRHRHAGLHHYCAR